MPSSESRYPWNVLPTPHATIQVSQYWICCILQMKHMECTCSLLEKADDNASYQSMLGRKISQCRLSPRRRYCLLNWDRPHLQTLPSRHIPLRSSSAFLRGLQRMERGTFEEQKVSPPLFHCQVCLSSFEQPSKEVLGSPPWDHGSLPWLPVVVPLFFLNDILKEQYRINSFSE